MTASTAGTSPVLFHNALVLSRSRPYSFYRSDVLVDGMCISRIGRGLCAEGCDVIDCSEKVLMPGLINAHTHSAMSLFRGMGDELPLHEWLETILKPREARLTQPHDIRIGVMLACAEMIHAGTTTFNDMFYRGMNIADAVAGAGMRAIISHGGFSSSELQGESPEALLAHLESRLETHPLGDGRVTFSIAPHSIYRLSREMLKNAAFAARRWNLPIHIHISETEQETQYSMDRFGLPPIEYLESCGLLCEKSVLAHGIHVTPREIEIIARSGASVIHNPIANFKFGIGGIAPVVDYARAGVNLGLGTDSAVSNNSLDIFQTMKFGVLIQKNHHRNSAIVSADDFLFMATEGGARALGLNTGVIRERCLADITLLDLPAPNLVPFTNTAGWLVYSAGAQNVSDVMVDGRFLMRNRTITSFDEAQVLQAAQSSASFLEGQYQAADSACGRSQDESRRTG